MDYEVFVLSNNIFLISGVRELIKERFPGVYSDFIVKQVTLMELMNVDSNYKVRGKYSVALVPDRMYEMLHIFSGMESIKMIPSNVSMSVVSSLLKDALILRNVQNRISFNSSLCLTAKERRYCYMIYSGMPNKKIARYFQCNEKNLSYLKRKIMSKWQCKNSLDFYKTINYFYGDSSCSYSESYVG
ncbi:helix-turn-helix transcriptional regulator [Pantoea agglomerans]|nr:helix-turn-helix transcriptional regulator [Pantoea agglomerans]WIL42754.1 helix-turn-helix transcriptional regulator [Pantoea agglomerans]